MPIGPESPLKEPSPARFYWSFLVAAVGYMMLGFVQLFVSALHSVAITIATGFLGGALVVAAVVATWRKLS